MPFSQLLDMRSMIEEAESFAMPEAELQKITKQEARTSVTSAASNNSYKSSEDSIQISEINPMEMSICRL